MLASIARAVDPEWIPRAVGELFGLIARIGASGDWLELSRSALRDGWDIA